MERWQRLSLRSKIVTLTGFLVIGSFSIGLLLTGYNLQGALIKELGRRAMSVARTVAQMDAVRQNLGRADGAAVIQPAVERVRLSTGVEYIVAFDMKRIRYSDPLAERIGQPFRGGDEGPSLSQQAYISRAAGVNGQAVRGFVPVISPDGGEQVGVIVVGIMVPPFWSLLKEFSLEIPVGILGAMVAALVGAWVLSANIKRQMFNLEPPEIARILEERVAVVSALSEGLIAIAEDGTLTVVNAEAQRIAEVGPDAVGKRISDVIPASQLPETLRTGQASYNEPLVLGHRMVISNRVPIRIQDRIVGAVATFRERTEVHRLAEELTGVKRFVEGLRAQNHESLNRLHTIAGLIHMKEYDQALEYIYSTTEHQEEVIRFLARQVKDYRISGLLLGKVVRARELGIDLHIAPDSQVTGVPSPLSGSDAALIIGNLLENAMDALGRSDGERRIACLVRSNAERLTIRVEDNGPGIPPELQDKVFVQGFSTKGEGRGLGLALVKQLVSMAGGRMDLASEPGRTAFTITVGEGDPSDRH